MTNNPDLTDTVSAFTNGDAPKPSQFWRDASRGDGMKGGGARGLAFAVLTAAAADTLSPFEDIQRRAREWIDPVTPNGDWPFSFVNLCDALGLSASAIRRGLLSGGYNPGIAAQPKSEAQRRPDVARQVRQVLADMGGKGATFRYVDLVGMGIDAKYLRNTLEHMKRRGEIEQLRNNHWRVLELCARRPNPAQFRRKVEVTAEVNHG